MTSYRELADRLRAAALRADRPVHAMMCLTHRCNLRCVHCYLAGSRDVPELDADGWRAKLDDAADAGVLWLALTGGEPLLRPDFAAIYRHAKQRGFLVTVMTNGTLIDDEVLALFRELPPHSVEVTLYAFSAATYRAITGADVGEAVYRAVEAMRGQRTRVMVKSVVLRANLGEIEAIRAWAGQRHLPYRTDPDIVGCLDHRLTDDAILKLTPPRLAKRVRSSRRFVCNAGRTSFHVAPDGAVGLCVLDVPLAAGQASVLEAWHGPLRRRRDAELPEGHPCAQCDLRASCSACAPVLRMESGSEDSVPVARCSFTHARDVLA